MVWATPWLALALVATMTACAPRTATAWPWDPVVETKQGKVMGWTSEGVDIFHEIPFAAPPTGANRFRPPQPVTAWGNGTTLDARSVSLTKLCPQLKVGSLVHLGQEDCLYLHVYSPSLKDRDPKKAPLPVLFWLFGGGYALGDGFEFGLYQGSNLAKAADAVVVAVNYRVGALGFMPHSALCNEQEDGTCGNYGVQDQRAGMRWVQENIAAFGGDPSRVTIFGESAGGFSVCYHLAAPASEGLFHAAIMESGSCDAQEFFRPLDDSNAFGDEYATAFGCNRTALGTDEAFLACAREQDYKGVMNGFIHMLDPDWPKPWRPWEKPRLVAATSTEASQSEKWLGAITATANAALARLTGSKETGGFGLPSEVAEAIVPPLAPVMPWGPVLDGSDRGLPQLPFEALRSGASGVSKVPVIMGSNENEGSIFVPLVSIIVPNASYPLDDDEVKVVLRHFFPDGGEQTVNDLLELYPKVRPSLSFSLSLSLSPYLQFV